MLVERKIYWVFRRKPRECDFNGNTNPSLLRKFAELLFESFLRINQPLRRDTKTHTYFVNCKVGRGMGVVEESLSFGTRRHSIFLSFAWFVQMFRMLSMPVLSVISNQNNILNARKADQCYFLINFRLFTEYQCYNKITRYYDAILVPANQVDVHFQYCRI